MALRTLLIDNYDSYTYNLYQLLSVIVGTAPRVVRNDEVSLAEVPPPPPPLVRRSLRKDSLLGRFRS